MRKRAGFPVEFRVGLGSCGLANGAGPVFEAARAAAAVAGRPGVVKGVGCGGWCPDEPLVEVVDEWGERARYARVDPTAARAIVRRHLGRATSWPPGLCSVVPSTDADRIVLERCGEVDPLSLADAREKGAYAALEISLARLAPEEIVDIVRASGLRGRGGAGFPTARKWDLAREGTAPRFVIANGDEGDPGAFMDRLVLESDPHRVLEGLAIAAYAIGAEEGVLYIREEYPLAVRHVREALRQAQSAGLLGGDACGSGHPLRFEVREGAGAFVCGEETALIASLSGERGTPRLRPPYPAERGFRGRPTVINNVETLACLPWILMHGAGAFVARGTSGSPGTKVFSLAGKVRRGGLIEVSMGTSVREIVEAHGGGVAEGRSLKAVQIGGPSGGCLPAELLDTPVDYEALSASGAIMGSGGLVVLDDRDCMVDVARYFLDFTRRESCGTCTFCRIGTQRMFEILDRLCAGQASREEVESLAELADRVGRASLCGLGQTAPNPVRSLFRFFRHEVEAHLEGRCPAGRCRALVRYRINTGCIGCTLCAQVCPVLAIDSRPHERHEIDIERCTRCDLCRQVCEDGAVEVCSP